MAESPDDRSALAQGIAWSAQITSIALEMVLPGMLGYWIDQKLGTRMVFLIGGVALGMTLGLLHLTRLPAGRRHPDAGAGAGRKKPEND